MEVKLVCDSRHGILNICLWFRRCHVQSVDQDEKKEGNDSAVLVANLVVYVPLNRENKVENNIEMLEFYAMCHCNISRSSAIRPKRTNAREYHRQLPIKLLGLVLERSEECLQGWQRR